MEKKKKERDVAPLSLHLQQEICCHVHLHSLVHNIPCFPLVAFRISYVLVTGFEQIGCDVPWYSLLHFPVLAIYWTPCISIIVFIKFGNFSIFISLNIFLSSLLGNSTYMYIWPLEVVSQLTNALFVSYFLFIFFSFYYFFVSFWIVSIAISSSSLIFLSSHVKLPLIPFSMFSSKIFSFLKVSISKSSTCTFFNIPSILT